MRGFDLQQLRSFVTAVDAGSLTAAAPLRFLSQSSLSEQIRKLEEAAGHRLVLRAKSGVSPTAAGARLLAHARQILALADDAWHDLHGTPLEGELSLAITDYFRTVDLAGLLARLGKAHPRLRVHVHVDKSDAIESAYATGEFDIAMTMRVPGQHAGPATGTLLRREALVWCASPDFQTKKGAPWPLISLAPTCSLRRVATALLEKKRHPYVIAHVASGVAGILAATAAGLGVACLNASALEAGGLTALGGRGLPALPDVAFRALAARPGERAVVSLARASIVETFRSA